MSKEWIYRWSSWMRSKKGTNVSSSDDDSNNHSRKPNDETANNNEVLDRFRKVLECSICLDLFHEPKMLPCTHEYCKSCLEKLVKFRDDGSLTITCPLRCKIGATLNHRKTLSDLSASYTTKYMLETFKAEDKTAGTTDSDNHPMCWIKDDCKKPIAMFCCNQMMCKCCHSEHAKKPPINHRKLPLVYLPREQKLGVLCDKHSSICTHYCVDNTFLCMYCLQRDHKTHVKHDIETEARLLRNNMLKEIAELEEARVHRIQQVEIVTTQFKQILEAFQVSRASRGKPPLPLEEAKLFDEVQKQGYDYINEHHKQSITIYDHIFRDSLSYLIRSSRNSETDLDVVLRKGDILKVIQNARSEKQHVTLKLYGFDSLLQPLGKINVEIKENTPDSIFEFIPPLSNDPDEAAALLSKLRGNDLFKEGKYKEAIACYTKAIDNCPHTSKEISVFYQNRAAANVQLAQWVQVVDDCNVAVQLNPSNYKAMFSRAKAHQALGEKREAYQNFAHGIVLTEELNTAYSAGQIRSRDSVLASLCEELSEEHLRKRTPGMISEHAFREHFSCFNYDVFNVPLTSHPSDLNYIKILSHMKQAKYEQAMKLCEKEITSKWKHRNRAYLLKGATKALLGNSVGALNDFRKVSELPPNWGNKMLRLDALLNMSWIQGIGEGNDAEGSLESLDKAARIDKHNATVHSFKGLLLSRLERYEEAKVNFKQAISLDQAYVRARIDYCDMLVKGRERFFPYEEAENAILETIQDFPDCSKIYTVYGNFLQFRGKHQEACVILDKAIALDPQDAEPYFAKSAILNRENPEEAERTLLQAVEVNCDKSGTAYHLLGKHQIKIRNDVRSSVKYFEKSLNFLSSKKELFDTLTYLEQAKVSVMISEQLKKNIWVG